MKSLLQLLLAALLAAAPAGARSLPRPGALRFKQVSEQRIIYVVHAGPEHLASSFAKLVAYYLKDVTPFTVVFPQMTIKVSDAETWVAVAYTGDAVPGGEVRLGTLPAATVASRVCRGSYERLDGVIGEAYRQISASQRYVPKSAPLRLLYWNSPDDNRPGELVTEIQIPVVPAR